jgi:NADH-quinone oxidoreductase subunit C
VADETDDVVVDEEEAAAPAPPPERHGAPLTESLGQEVLHPTREQYPDVVDALYDEGYTVCVDVTAVDYAAHPARDTAPGVPPERFEVVAQFLDHAQKRRIRLRVQVPADDPTVPSIVDRHPGADALEREVFDMFGITFEGHPDLTRILMPEDWEGHPLRKDYAVGAIPVQFKGVGREERP